MTTPTAPTMATASALKSSGKLIIAAPFLFCLGVCPGGLLLAFHHKHEHIAFAVAATVVFVVSMIGPFWMMGRAANLLGWNGLYFGLLPVLFMPVGPIIAWAILLHRRMTLGQQAAQG